MSTQELGMAVHCHETADAELTKKRDLSFPGNLVIMNAIEVKWKRRSKRSSLYHYFFPGKCFELTLPTQLSHFDWNPQIRGAVVLSIRD